MESSVDSRCMKKRKIHSTHFCPVCVESPRSFFLLADFPAQSVKNSINIFQYCPEKNLIMSFFLTKPSLRSGDIGSCDVVGRWV